MCTSSMMNTRYFPLMGGMSTWSVRERISSTLLLEAASISMMLSERCSLNARHDSHSLHGSPSAVRCSQLMAFAKMRAVVVFPTPRCPQKRYECASRPVSTALRSVLAKAACPTIDLNVDGRYLRADTIYFSIRFFL